MSLNPYLSFAGNCEEAFKFYEQHLDGKLQFMMKWGGSPAEKQVSPEWHDKVMHATLEIEGQPLMGADPPPESYRRPEGIAVSISVNDVDKAERIFGALSEGGKVTMDIQQTFWAKRFGMVTDRFSIPWMINCE